MLKSYLLLAARTLQRRKGYALLNLGGLAVGMAVALLIALYVQHEGSYDTFHADVDQVHRIALEIQREGTPATAMATNLAALAPTLAANMPEIDAFARVTRRYGGGVIRYEDQFFRESEIFHADASLLSILTYPMLRGDAATALIEPNTTVLSAAAAQKYFGDQNPIGHVIQFGADEPYTVTGVVDVPANTHFRFDFLFSYQTLEQLWDFDRDTSWGGADFVTYVRLKPHVDAEAFAAGIPEVFQANGPQRPGVEARFILQPVRDIHLTSDLLFELSTNGDGQTVTLLALVALFVLLIAWVNYVNLTTARAMERTKEVGVRKAIGAQKRQLIGQFLMEALVFNVIAGGIAFAVVQASLSGFAELTGQTLSADLLFEGRFLGLLALMIAVGTLLSGLYPALMLAQFRTVRALKGRFSEGRRDLGLRQGLVAFQFAASVALLVCTVVVYEQIQFMQGQDLGISIDQTVVFETPGTVGGNAAFIQQFESFKAELLQNAAIQRVATSSEYPGAEYFWTSTIRRLESSSDPGATIYTISVDYDYLEAYEHELLAGHFLSADRPADQQAVILNRAAAEALRWSAPEASLNEQILMRGDTVSVAGVIENHHQQGLHHAQYPIVFRVMPGEYQFFSVKLATTDLTTTIATLEETYQRFFPGNPFTYDFLDARFGAQYQTYQRFGQIVLLFTLLALFVACLGLFGLASFAAARRTKEIGIRKVLGAELPTLVGLLTKQFLGLVLIGSVTATPIAALVATRWLDDFAFRITLDPLMFIGAIGVVFVVALLSVGYQSLRAALAKPVDALRYE